MRARYRLLLCVALAGAGVLMAAAPAGAQDKKVEVNLGGGYTWSLSEVRNHLGDGYNIDFGVTFNVNPVFGLQVEYGFTGLGSKQVNLPVYPAPVQTAGATQPFYADMNMQYVDFNVVLKPRTEGKVKPYLVGGIGYYHRPVKVTTPSSGYVPGWCDPWWYVCYPGGWVPVTQVVGSRSSNDFGIDLGGGVRFAVWDRTSVYIEARYHYMWGPAVATTYAVEGNNAQKANGQFLPLTVGIRF